MWLANDSEKERVLRTKRLTRCLSVRYLWFYFPKWFLSFFTMCWLWQLGHSNISSSLSIL